ncbi:MAG: type II secretion system protein GspM [Halothiobacillus sp.]
MSGLRWRPWLSVGSTLVSVVLVWGLALWVIVQAQHRAEQNLVELAPKYARLIGLRTSGAPIEQALAEQQKQLDQLVYDPAAGLDRVGADLQQKIRAAMTSSGINVQGSQVFTPKPDEKASMGFITVSLNIAGTLDTLRAALVATSEIRPRIYVTDLQILPALRGNADEGGQQLTAVIRLSALYVVKP